MACSAQAAHPAPVPEAKGRRDSAAITAKAGAKRASVAKPPSPLKPAEAGRTLKKGVSVKELPALQKGPSMRKGPSMKKGLSIKRGVSIKEPVQPEEVHLECCEHALLRALLHTIRRLPDMLCPHSKNHISCAGYHAGIGRA